jgi:hypothetical protein
MTLKRSLRRTAPVCATVCATVALTLAASSAGARDLRNDGVASANPRFELVGQPNEMAPGFSLVLAARGVAKLENP